MSCHRRQPEQISLQVWPNIGIHFAGQDESRHPEIRQERTIVSALQHPCRAPQAFPVDLSGNFCRIAKHAGRGGTAQKIAGAIGSIFGRTDPAKFAHPALELCRHRGGFRFAITRVRARQYKACHQLGKPCGEIRRHGPTHRMTDQRNSWLAEIRDERTQSFSIRINRSRNQIGLSITRGIPGDHSIAGGEARKLESPAFRATEQAVQKNDCFSVPVRPE